MKILFVTLLALPMLMLAGCGQKTAKDAEKPAEQQAKLPDEFTSEKQMPSVLEENLSPEEKSAILKEIMPAGSESDSTPEERFLQLKKRRGGWRSQSTDRPWRYVLYR